MHIILHIALKKVANFNCFLKSCVSSTFRVYREAVYYTAEAMSPRTDMT